MRILQSLAAGLALVLTMGLFAGCDPNAPRPKTPAETARSDSRTQDEMRKYYGNMIGDKAKSKAKTKAKPSSKPG